MDHFRAFKSHLDKLREAEDRSQMHVNILLVINRNVDRYKEDVLSDIRAISGITIIKVMQHRNIKNLDYNIVSMKFDRHPFGNESVVKTLMKIRRDLLNIPGIVRVKYVTRPELIGPSASR